MTDSAYKWRYAKGIGWERIRMEGDVKVETSDASVLNGHQSSMGLCSFFLKRDPAG